MLRRAALLAAVLAAGCGADSAPLSSTGGTATWRSEVDGLTATYPASWHVAAAPVTPYDTDTFEVLALATFELAAGDGRCNPVPLGALEAMGPGDVVLVLREAMPGWEEAEPVAAVGRPDCPPAGLGASAEERDVVDEATGRRFWAYVAAGAKADEATVASAWAVVESLRVEALPGPEDDVPIGRPVRHVLAIHCGVEAATFAGREWVADPPLGDGQGNPPDGFDGRGTMTLEAPDRAVFRSVDGDTAEFRPRTPEDPPLPPCD